MPSNEKTPKKGWKEHLLRSGLPLEYEVAKLLAQEGMMIEADHSFFRKEGNIYKEWSTDLTADWYSSPDQTSIDFKLEILLECKYRSPEKSLLLVKDPNYEMPLGILGGGLIAIDQHMPFSLNSKAIEKFERKMPSVYKAIEIYENGAHDEDIRHGIQQLKYGSISLLNQSMRFAYSSHSDDLLAFFFCRVLVTNASIRVFKVCRFSASACISGSS